MTIRKTPTILEATLWGKRELEKTGITNPRSQSETLLCHALKKDRLYLHLNPGKELAAESWNLFQEAVSRRAGGEPLQYITGIQNFMGFDFAVTPDVLIPRQDTERLIEVVMEWVQGKAVSGQPLRPGSGQASAVSSFKIADLGTGSGAIGVTLAKLNPSAQVYCVDISEKALEMARKNAVNLEVEDKITFLQGDLFEPLEPLNLRGQLDIVTSNPPYIAFAEKKTLAVEVREHEPHLALFAPGEGLEFHKKIIPGARTFLKPGGLLALEIGSSQAEDVKALFEEVGGYRKISVFQDYSGLDRVVTAIKG